MILIFLHGLLGTKQDWQDVIQRLPNEFHCYALDLPLHGENKHIRITDFASTNAFLNHQIQQITQSKDYVLIGYSLGGRIALYHSLNQPPANLKGIILEGANLGLTNENERQLRWQNDCQWAKRFQTESPDVVLNDWYRQAVFAHLNEQERLQLIAKRSSNCGENISQMLRATSLAKQPDFSQQIQTMPVPFYYFCGEQDQKFQQLAKQHNLPLIRIPQAGHNAHLENAKAFAKELERKIELMIRA